MKKFFAIFLLITCLFSLTACNREAKKAPIPQNEEVDKDVADRTVNLAPLGVKLVVPEAWLKYRDSNNLGVDLLNGGQGNLDTPIYDEIMFTFIPTEQVKILMEDAKKAKTPEEKDKVVAEIRRFSRDICSIMILNKDNLNGRSDDEFFKEYTDHFELAQKDNFEFYFLYNDKYDLNNLSEEDKASFNELVKGLPELRDSIKVGTITPAKVNELVSFETTDLNGNKVTNDIFKNSKLTMVNVWGTYCPPCIEEMPYIQEIYEEMKKENVNIIGIVGDVDNKDKTETAKTIVEKTGVKYVNIIPDDNLRNTLLKDQIKVFPTTFFVDGNGNIVGNVIMGERSKDNYKELINNTLKNIK